MIVLDMIKKTDVCITHKHYSLENGIFTLQIDVGDYDLTNKTITAKFSPKEVETGSLDVIGGVINLPIYSNLLKSGVNYIQLNFRWDENKLEQSPRMMWNISPSLAATEAAQEDVDIITYLVSIATQANDNAINALNEANRIVDEAEGVRMALDESVETANTAKVQIEDSTRDANIAKGQLDASVDLAGSAKNDLDGSIILAEGINEILTNAENGTIKQATDINAELAGTIEGANTSKEDLDESIEDAGQAKADLDGSISTAGTAKRDLDESIINATAINNTLVDEETGTIKRATEINAELDENITTASGLKSEIEQAIIDNQIVTLPVFNQHKEDLASQRQQDNLKVALVEKELNNYKSTIASINPNQEAKQTTSGYGAVSLPVNAANGQVSASVGGNTVTDEDGTAHTVSACRLVSANEDETDTTYQYYPDVGLLRSLPNGTKDEISFNEQTGQWEKIQRVKLTMLNGSESWVYTDAALTNTEKFSLAIMDKSRESSSVISLDKFPVLPHTDSDIEGANSAFHYVGIRVLKSRLIGYSEDLTGTQKLALFKAWLAANPLVLTYQLASPIVMPINVTGTLIGHPNGTIYFEPVLPVAGVYITEGVAVTNTDFSIDSIEQIVKIDFATGLETPVDVSQAVIAGDGLSFTHPDLIDGDIVFFTYYHGIEGTQPKIDVEYYDSRYVEEDSAVPGKFYKISYKVTNGVVTPIATEV